MLPVLKIRPVDIWGIFDPLISLQQVCWRRNEGCSSLSIRVPWKDTKDEIVGRRSGLPKLELIAVCGFQGLLSTLERIGSRGIWPDYFQRSGGGIRGEYCGISSS